MLGVLAKVYGFQAEGEVIIYLIGAVCFVLGVVIGGYCGWRFTVWSESKWAAEGGLVFRDKEGNWIGTPDAIEGVWRKYNADCLKRR